MADFVDTTKGLHPTGLPTLFLLARSRAEVAEWAEKLTEVEVGEDAFLKVSHLTLHYFARDAQGEEFDNFKDLEKLRELHELQEGLLADIVEAIYEARENLGKPLGQRFEAAAQRARTSRSGQSSDSADTPPPA